MTAIFFTKQKLGAIVPTPQFIVVFGKFLEHAPPTLVGNITLQPPTTRWLQYKKYIDHFFPLRRENKKSRLTKFAKILRKNDKLAPLKQNHFFNVFLLEFFNANLVRPF